MRTADVTKDGRLDRGTGGFKEDLLTKVYSLDLVLVALFVVMPLKGKGFAAGGNPVIIIGALVVNAVWGLGTALLLRLLARLYLRLEG